MLINQYIIHYLYRSYGMTHTHSHSLVTMIIMSAAFHFGGRANDDVIKCQLAF